MKKFLKCFFAVFLICLIGFFCLPAKKISALEVDYPVIQNYSPSHDTDLTLPKYLKYVFDVGIFIGFFAVFLTLIYAGVLYFLSPAIPNALAMAKDRISGAISGLLILVLLYLIITTINPALKFFQMGKLEPVPEPKPEETQPIGLNLFASQDCSGDVNTYIANIQDLGNLKNTINSAGIVHDTENQIYYISVLYEQTNYWGKCQYIDPNTKCLKIGISPSSASVYKFDFSPDGDGVYFYRESFNGLKGKEDNKNGGFLKISNSEIKKSKIYVGSLNNLKFTGNSSDYNNIDSCTVPKDEQDCSKWDNKGKCLNFKCPALAEKNISSIKISGDYVVLLVYFAPTDNSRYGPWTYCQAYPSANDINKNGPQQIKWDAVNVNNLTQDPNYVIIIPMAET